MSLPLAVDLRNDFRKHFFTIIQLLDHSCSLFPPTFEKPVRVTLLSAVGLQERKDILGDVFHDSRGESRVLQMRDVLCFYHLVFLK